MNREAALPRREFRGVIVVVRSTFRTAHIFFFRVVFICAAAPGAPPYRSFHFLLLFKNSLATTTKKMKVTLKLMPVLLF